MLFIYSMFLIIFKSSLVDKALAIHTDPWDKVFIADVILGICKKNHQERQNKVVNVAVASTHLFAPESSLWALTFGWLGSRMGGIPAEFIGISQQNNTAWPICEKHRLKVDAQTGKKTH